MNCIHPSLLLCAAAFSSQAATLSGLVVDQDSLPVAGVVVSLSSASSSPVTTGADGAWSFAVADGIATRTRTGSKFSNARVQVDGDRLCLSLGGYDISGRPLAGAAVAAPSGAVAGVVARASGLETPDTLSLSWKGKVILRDTMYESAQQGIVLTFDTTLNANILYGHVADAQGHYYRTVRIAGRTWTAQNMRLATDSSWCYDGVDSNCHRYGRLYQWHAAMAVEAQYDQNALDGDTVAPQGICPKGWHLPRYGEWDTLFQAIGGASVAGHLLKAASGWSTTSGVDTFGLHIVPSGYRIGTGDFYQVGAYADFWSSSEFDSDAGMWYFNKSSALYDHYDKRYAYSVRCVAN